MADCRDLEPLLTAYVDGEAAPGERASVQAHLNRCPPCRDVVAGQRAARDLIVARREGLRACASEQLRARCAAQCPVARVKARWAGRPGRPGWRIMVPLSVAATLVLAIGGLFLYSAVDQVEALAAQAALDHMKCAQVGSPPTDPVAAAARWASTYGWPISVPASAPDRQLEFVSVRRCLVTEGRAAHMLYTWRGQPLSVFVLRSPLDAGAAQRIVESFGYEAIMWSADGRTYVMVARGPRDQMDPVVRYVRANAR